MSEIVVLRDGTELDVTSQDLGYGRGPEMGAHVHAYADPVRTHVYQVRVIETWGDWYKTVETWTYVCDCGDRVDTRRESDPPPNPDRFR